MTRLLDKWVEEESIVPVPWFGPYFTDKADKAKMEDELSEVFQEMAKPILAEIEAEEAKK